MSFGRSEKNKWRRKSWIHLSLPLPHYSRDLEPTGSPWTIERSQNEWNVAFCEWVNQARHFQFGGKFTTTIFLGPLLKFSCSFAPPPSNLPNRATFFVPRPLGTPTMDVGLKMEKWENCGKQWSVPFVVRGRMLFVVLGIFHKRKKSSSPLKQKKTAGKILLGKRFYPLHIFAKPTDRRCHRQLQEVRNKSKGLSFKGETSLSLLGAYLAFLAPGAEMKYAIDFRHIISLVATWLVFVMYL